MDRHLILHERSKIWSFVCEYEDHGLKKHVEGSGSICCEERFKCQALLDYHISYAHTVHGVEKRQSEEQMAVFLNDNGILFDRDRENTLHFNHCQNVDPNPHPKANKRTELLEYLGISLDGKIPKGFVIDHIKERKTCVDDDDFKTINYYSNLRLLPEIDNLARNWLK